MEALPWIAAHWFDLLQSAAIISGFVFTAHTIRKEGEARRVNTRTFFGQQHYSIWKELYNRPELARAIEERGALNRPVTSEERIFVTSVVLNLDGIHRAIKAKMFVRMEGLESDVKDFFSRPVPNAVWKTLKPFQDEDFVAFVEKCLGD